jgi:Amidohydrolase family
MGNLTRVLAIAACALVGAAAQQADPRPIAIVHATLIDGRGGPPVRDATLLIRGRVIEGAGPATQVAVPKDAQVIDATGKTVMPGLADMHVHLQGGWDGIGIDFLGYQRYLNALLYAGVTTVLDTGNSQPFILQLRQEVASGRVLRPRIYCVGAFVDGVDAAWPDMSYIVATIAQIPDIVRRDKRAGVDLIKGYSNLSDTLMPRLAREAAKVNLRVVVDQYDRNGAPEPIRAATYDAARVMRAEREWGSLEPGKRADVLVVAGRPAERISDTRKIDLVTIAPSPASTTSGCSHRATHLPGVAMPRSPPRAL